MRPQHSRFLQVSLINLTTVMLAWLPLNGTAHPQVQVPALSGAQAYKIAAQDLATALRLYAATSGFQVLYESALVNGQKSAELDGTATPIEALQKLLAGTDLVGRMTDIDAVTIVARPRERAYLPSGAELQFVGGVRQSIVEALCQSPMTQARDFRIAIQLWITDYGVVRRVALLSSTGDLRRDDVVTQALQHLTLNRPPAGLPQPLTLAILPQAYRVSACEARQ